MTDKNKHKVFVYGTLRPRDEEGNYVEATHFLADFGMYNYLGKFPYIEEQLGSMVAGNIIEVDDLKLAQLDRYEGLPNNLYARIEVTVEPFDGGGDVEAWVYVADEISLRIPSGDWTSVAA